MDADLQLSESLHCDAFVVVEFLEAIVARADTTAVQVRHSWYRVDNDFQNGIQRSVEQWQALSGTYSPLLKKAVIDEPSSFSVTSNSTFASTEKYSGLFWMRIWSVLRRKEGQTPAI